jgi:hypothetical protein
MADDESSKRGGTATEARPGSQIGGTRVPWVVIGLLVVIMGGIAVAKKKPEPPKVKLEGARAVQVPTTDRGRIVIVPPCKPPVEVTAANAKSMSQVPGATFVQLRRHPGVQYVVVPHCSRANYPSALFVLAPGEVPSEKDSAEGNPIRQGINSQVVIPNASPISTVVVRPCVQSAETRSTAGGTVLNPVEPGADVAVAPDC